MCKRFRFDVEKFLCFLFLISTLVFISGTIVFVAMSREYISLAASLNQIVNCSASDMGVGNFTYYPNGLSTSVIQSYQGIRGTQCNTECLDSNITCFYFQVHSENQSDIDGTVFRSQESMPSEYHDIFIFVCLITGLSAVTLFIISMLCVSKLRNTVTVLNGPNGWPNGPPNGPIGPIN